jgi:hypothetical protein
MILDDLGVAYEIVEEIPGGADAYYSYETGKITVERGKGSTYLLLHELIHKLRHDAGMVMESRIEEHVAVEAAYELGRVAGIQLGVGRYNKRLILNNTLKANNLEVRRLTEAEELIVDKEIEKSVQLVLDKLEERGYSATDIDPVKTAILLLL